MVQATKKKELQIMTEDKVGMLAEVTSLVSSAGVNIEAMCAYGMQGKATFLLITSDNNKVKQAIAKKGWGVEEHDVVVTTLADKTGTASEVANTLKAKNINLLYSYVTCSNNTCKIVMRAENSEALAAAVSK